MNNSAKIFDLNNLLYRVFFTSTPRYNHKGIRNDVTLRINSDMIKLKSKLPEGDEIFIVSDHNGPTFRHALSDSYKSESKGMPEELKVQELPTMSLLSSNGFKVISKPDFEADDAIAMVANYLLANGFSQVEIHSNDKDLLQLITPEISVFNPSSKKLFKREDVIEKYGIPPELIPDMLALSGDSADGIIGIEGVGEKTACNWLKEHESAANVFANKDNMKGRGVKALKETTLDLALNMKLSTIVQDPTLLSPHEVNEIKGLNANSDNFFNELDKEFSDAPLFESNLTGNKIKTNNPKDKKTSSTPQLSFF